MSAVTIIPPASQTQVIVSDEELNKIEKLIESSAIITLIPARDEAAFKVADHLCSELAKQSKSIEAHRLLLGTAARKYLEDLKKFADDARVPLDEEFKRLGAIVKKWQDDENTFRAEEARKAREEAARLQKIADDAAEEARLKRIEEERVKRDAIIAEQQAEAAAAVEAGDDPLPVDEPPEIDEQIFVAPVRTVVMPTFSRAPAVTSHVRKSKKKILIIDDESLIPDEIQGAQLWIRDDATIKRLLIANVKIPGCHLEEDNGVAPTGR